MKPHCFLSHSSFSFRKNAASACAGRRGAEDMKKSRKTMPRVHDGSSG